MLHFPTERVFARTAAKAAPWWIAIGVTGVTVAILSGHAPLLASLALVGIGSDADLARRLREALAAEGDRTHPSDPALVAGLVRRVHAAMYGVLIFFAWASLLHAQVGRPGALGGGPLVAGGGRGRGRDPRAGLHAPGPAARLTEMR